MEVVEAPVQQKGLVEQYQTFARNIAWSLIRRLRIPTDASEDLISAAYLGLVEAAERFDPSAEREFPAFALFRIRGAVIDALRKSSDLQGRAYRRLKAYEAANELREQQRLASDKPAAEPSSDALARIFRFAAESALIYRLHDLSDGELENMVIDLSTPELHAIDRSRGELLKKLIAELPDLERLIIEQYYFHGISFVDICRMHAGVSKSWLSRLHARAISRLRVRLDELQSAGEEV